MSKRVEVRKQRGIRYATERVSGPSIESVRPAGPDQGLAAKGHRAGRGAGQRRTFAPRLEDCVPNSRGVQHLDPKARVAANQIEESTRASAGGQVLGVGIDPFQYGQLLQVEAELAEPALGMRHRAIRALPRSRGGNDKGRPGAGALGEDPILLLIARVELVASDQGEHSSDSRHVPSISRRGSAAYSRHRLPEPRRGWRREERIFDA